LACVLGASKNLAKPKHACLLDVGKTKT
jgi:hypothetical protein